MKAFLSIKYFPDHRNRLLIEELTILLEKFDFRTVCIARDYELWGERTYKPPDLMRITFDEISTSDVLVAESSVRGVGIGIEAGYAAARGIPVIVIARLGTVISTTLNGIASSSVHYSNYQDLERSLCQALAMIGGEQGRPFANP